MEFLMVLFTVEFWKGFLGLLLIGIIAYFLIDWIVSKYKTNKKTKRKKERFKRRDCFFARYCARLGRRNPKRIFKN